MTFVVTSAPSWEYITFDWATGNVGNFCVMEENRISVFQWMEQRQYIEGAAESF